MSDPTLHPEDKNRGDAPVRPHEFDGIQEFDNAMPNWWLFTLWITIFFAFGYWAILHRYGEEPNPGRELTARMEAASREAARQAGKIDDAILWAMSREAAVVKAGRETYASSCAACHLPDLGGAIGPNLRDDVWIHGSQPMTVLKVVTEGVQAKGMPTWGPVLGRQKIAEVVAFILSHHTPPPATSAPSTSPTP